MLNGHLGEKIQLHCGIRQGDPASGYLFNLAVNILAQQIKRSDKLTGIRISENNEVRISQYADDTVLFLKNSSECLQGALLELERFSEISGMRLNKEKALCMQIGAANMQRLEGAQGINWVTQMKILGIHVTNDNKNITQHNFEPKLAQIGREITQWRRRNITPIGRITVINPRPVRAFLITRTVRGGGGVGTTLPPWRSAPDGRRASRKRPFDASRRDLAIAHIVFGPRSIFDLVRLGQRSNFREK